MGQVNLKTSHFEGEGKEDGSYNIEVLILDLEPTPYLLGTFHRTDSQQPSPSVQNKEESTGTLQMEKFHSWE